MMVRVLALLLLLFLQGCGAGRFVSNYFGGEDNSEPPAPLVEFDQTATIITRWEQNVGGTDEQYLKLSPAVAEERIYTNLHPLSLLNIGFAVFVDAGKNWFRDEGAGSRDLLTDVGFGLRLVPSKSDKNQVIHIDFAHPLDQSLPNVDSLQITAELKQSL